MNKFNHACSKGRCENNISRSQQLEAEERWYCDNKEDARKAQSFGAANPFDHYVVGYNDTPPSGSRTALE